ncbi:hypothetical protein BDQ17DRAFT_1398065 [Cyathus striatus]|nr:hypothetical protein BDQ17DRAFT_1398065 [Cyathus striatus]
MKYVALLSGGKDSCYNLLHCAKNGHELVAAATLGPEPGKEELDSYLYQTVGQDAINLIAQALEVPLYRQVIKGTAVEQGSHYGDREDAVKGTEGDETEDLFTLLSTVKSKHPEVQGVSVGAILSNYQRVRVEHVCRRLGLTSLAYLWQRDQAELLSEMIEAGMLSILIKVAGIGLTTKHLGLSLTEMQPTLSKLNALYGLHVCGEGGEYETFTLDCPLFKYRINLIDTETVIHSDNDFATVAFLRLKNAVLEKKADLKDHDIAIPLLLDEQCEQLQESLIANECSKQVLPVLADLNKIQYCVEAPVTCRVNGPWICVSNVECDINSFSQGMSIEDEVRECFRIVAEHLLLHGQQLSSCVNINIYISTMELFTCVNSIYGTFFGASPPARACVAVDLPHPVRVRLECIAFNGNLSDRQGLHVQGLSYWAPANIGPYSQAILAGEMAFVSGQIGLIPSSLALPSPRSTARELALAMQHVYRIKTVLQSITGNNWTGFPQVMIYWLTDPKNVPFAIAAHAFLNIQSPSLFIGIKELPRGADVEIQTFLHTGRFMVPTDDEEEMHNVLPKFEENDIAETQDCHIHTETIHFPGHRAACVMIYIRGADLDHSRVKAELCRLSGSVLSVRLFHCLQISHKGFFNIFPITCVPCRFISTRNKEKFDYALCAIITGN